MTAETEAGLESQLRALVEAAPPVGADEAIARANLLPRALPSEVGVRSRRRARVVGVGVAASAVAVAGAGAGLGWILSSGTDRPAAQRAAMPPKVVLTAAELHAITTRSSAAASSSGTAEVTESSSQDGVPQDGYDIAVTFSGQSIDEKITSVPEPPGSASPFTTDDRLVDGQFYIYTPGPGDVLEWLHDTNSADDVASMQFPDPRTLYRAISPGARFSVAGTTTMNGETVTELAADEPGAIDTTALGNLTAGGGVTSFELWVDADDVVQQISLSTSQTSKVCKLLPLSSAQRQALLQKDGQTVTLPDGKTAVVVPKRALVTSAKGDCGPTTTVTHVVVRFADLGVPQSVTAPNDAVDFAGKG